MNIHNANKHYYENNPNNPRKSIIENGCGSNIHIITLERIIAILLTLISIELLLLLFEKLYN